MATVAVPERRSRWAAFYDETARFLKKKIAAVDLFDETFADRVTDNPWYAVGSITYLFWLITVVTGLLLIMWYIPNTTHAFDTIIAIKEGPLTGLVRGLHKYGADAVIIAATMRVYRLYFTGEYKTRELAWVLSIVTLLLGMFSGLTGYLLIWNQRAFWASKVFATFPTYLDQVPLINMTHLGMTTAQFMLGGTAIGEATMTRFYSGHFALSMAALIFVEAYFLRTGLRRINLGWLGIGICLSMLAIITWTMPPELGSRANRAETPLPILSDWYFLGLYQMMKEMKPLYAVLGTMVIPLAALLMPAFDGAKEVPTWRRPFFFMVGLAAFIYWLLLSWMIISDHAQITTDPPQIWASFTLFLLVGAVFEFKAMGFPKRQVGKRVVRVWVGWLVLYLIFAFWTRFRQPAYAQTYYPPGTYQVLTNEDPAFRDQMNNRYNIPHVTAPLPENLHDMGVQLGKTMANLKLAATNFYIKEWYVAPSKGDEQRQKLLEAHASVRGVWLVMTFILLLCGLIAWQSTPPGGIESAIWPTRTLKGQKIKGLKPEAATARGRPAPPAPAPTADAAPSETP